MPVTEDDELREILALETVAVVGCSSTPGKDAHEIPRYLREAGYTVVPVNPNADEIFGHEPADSLADVAATIDIVNVFRPSDEVAGIVDATLDRDDSPVIWTQLGICDPDATDRAEAAGLRVVEAKCMKVEHRRLC